MPSADRSQGYGVVLPRRSPDYNAALEQYRDRASLYDFELMPVQPVRRRAIGLLGLKRGDTVLDVGCGTGLSLARLRERVGAEGTVIGIEQSPDMIEQARMRVTERGWRNVRLICSPVQDACIEGDADAALFHFTHDILRTPAALANVMAHVKSRGTVVAAGIKWAPPWAMPANLFVLPAALRSVTSFEGLSEPWSHLGRWLDGLEVEPLLGGGAFLALGFKGRRERRNGPVRWRFRSLRSS